MTAGELIVHTMSIVAILYVVKLIGGLLLGAVRDWWRKRRRDLSDLVADNAQDVYAEDLPCRCSQVVDFADIASTMPDLDALDRSLAGLYLIPEEGR